MKTFFLALAIAFSLAGCADTNCKSMCDKLKACNLAASNVSCDENCKDKDADCAGCLNDSNVTCANVKDKCGSSCPAATLEPKK